MSINILTISATIEGSCSVDKVCPYLYFNGDGFSCDRYGLDLKYKDIGKAGALKYEINKLEECSQHPMDKGE